MRLKHDDAPPPEYQPMVLPIVQGDVEPTEQDANTGGEAMLDVREGRRAGLPVSRHVMGWPYRGVLTGAC